MTGLLKLWAYLRKSFDALKCLLMHQPMIVANQRGEHACNVAQNCGLRKFHISTIFACSKRILMVLRDLICKKNEFTVFSLTFKRLSPTYMICFSSSSVSFAWHKILNRRIFLLTLKELNYQIFLTWKKCFPSICRSWHLFLKMNKCSHSKYLIKI